MKSIITDLTLLETPSEPFALIDGKELTKDACNEIVSAIKELLETTPDLLALSAPQIGINKRIFCLKFADGIKTFINPVITKKSGFEIAPETFGSMPGYEILIARPTEISAVYYTDDFKYEENKILGGAARLFDQQAQLLDGVLPSELGLVSNVEEDGSLADLAPEELPAVIDIYKKYIAAKTKAASASMTEDDELLKQYRQIKLAEDVVNGRAEVVANETPAPKMNRAQRRALDKMAKKSKRRA